MNKDNDLMHVKIWLTVFIVSSYLSVLKSEHGEMRDERKRLEKRVKEEGGKTKG